MKNYNNEGIKTPKKGELTRKRILHAARSVFSKHPYHAASVRMVGKEGGFDHPIIHYYFPKKVGLFRAVIDDLLEEYSGFGSTWYKDLSTMSPRKGLSLFIDRLFEFHYNTPEMFRTIIQNTAHVDDFEQFPAARQYSDFHDSFEQTFIEQIPHTASNKEISRFVFSFTVMITNYLGASSTYAKFMSMDADSMEYKAWVKETLMFIFLPRLEKIIFSDAQK
jgi:AcrR family transcriptional regulator